MTKKWIASIALLALAAGVAFFVIPRPIGSINHRYAEQTTTASAISFTGQSGDRLRFLFDSGVESGELDVVLYDSAGNEVYVDALDFDRASSLKTYFSLDRADTYTLEAQCSDFIGDYRIRLYEAI